MKLEKQTIKLRTDNNGQPYFCGRVHFVNEHAFDSVSDIECIVEVSYYQEMETIKLFDIQALDENQESIDFEFEIDMDGIRENIFKAIEIIN
ncbi:MAG: hypothetical protein WC389_06535 [Lutibacter sp.]|jgi:hypothetical protein